MIARDRVRERWRQQEGSKRERENAREGERARTERKRATARERVRERWREGERQSEWGRERDRNKKRAHTIPECRKLKGQSLCVKKYSHFQSERRDPPRGRGRGRGRGKEGAKECYLARERARVCMRTYHTGVSQTWKPIAVSESLHEFYTHPR